MSRDDGFPVADVDTGLAVDPKMIRLVRRIGDGDAALRHFALFVSTVLASWAAGQRVTLEDAVPAWYVAHPVDDALANLQAVGLLDAEGRIPEKSWAGWHGPAETRRLAALRSRIFGGLVSQGMTRDAANAEADRRIGLRAELSKPDFRAEVPSVPSSPSINPSAQPSVPTPQAEERARDADALEGSSPRGRKNGTSDEGRCLDCGRPVSLHAETCPARENPQLLRVVGS
jgi:hypothetical protein